MLDTSLYSATIQANNLVYSRVMSKLKLNNPRNFYLLSSNATTSFETHYHRELKCVQQKTFAGKYYLVYIATDNGEAQTWLYSKLHQHTVKVHHMSLLIHHAAETLLKEPKNEESSWKNNTPVATWKHAPLDQDFRHTASTNATLLNGKLNYPTRIISTSTTPILV